ncbi:MAG TPA: uridine kinase, partial [Terricaulis sp.]|nr:uridine kinase [Terricaulis sp.]
DKPVYDLTTHRRTLEVERIAHAEYVIVEGIHLLASDELRPLFDVRVFMDSDESLRLGRRMIRDVESRGRTPRSVLVQFFTHVRPMHELHVEPQRALADLVIECPYDAGPVHADESAARIAALLGLRA